MKTFNLRIFKEKVEGILKKIRYENHLRYLSQSALLEEGPLPYQLRFLTLFLSSMVIILLLMAAFTSVKEVAKATGEIIPASPIQTIQHLDGGNIEKLLVDEGTLVEKNQILLTLSGGSTRGELERTKTKNKSLEDQAERYKLFAALIDTSNIQVSPTMDPEEKKILQSMLENRDKQQSVLREQIDQKKESIPQTSGKIETLKKNLRLSQELLRTRQQLYRQGYTPKIMVIETEKEVNILKGELEKTRKELIQNRQSVEEYENRLKSLNTSLRDDALQKFSNLQVEINENKKIIQKLQDQVDRLDLRSPITGIIKGLEFKGIGGVIGPGQKIMEIVPTDSTLLAEIKINPADMGNLHPGLPCLVKATSFEYVRYGALPGKLLSISPSTFLTKEGTPYYKGRVELERNYFADNPHFKVIPGNTVTVEIITGERSLLSYFLKPFQTTIEGAFRER